MGVAARQGVSVPRLLVEAALAGDGWTPTQRRGLVRELLAARRDLAGLATNVNQLARWANTVERFPHEAAQRLARSTGRSTSSTRPCGGLRRRDREGDQGRTDGRADGLPGGAGARERARGPAARGRRSRRSWRPSRTATLRDRERVREAAHELDGPRVAHDTAVLVKERPAHVWHASLTLRADEGVLSDEQWRRIAEGFVERMGFAEDCRWAAVRHGVSKAGNDHVHVVVNLVREDGTAADTGNDYRRASGAARELEREHGLRVVEGRELGVGARGYHRAEREVAEALDKPEPARDYLERVVRGSAAVARDEHEFVARLRDAGVNVRPRYAQGARDVVGATASRCRPATAASPSGTAAGAWRAT